LPRYRLLRKTQRFPIPTIIVRCQARLGQKTVDKTRYRYRNEKVSA